MAIAFDQVGTVLSGANTTVTGSFTAAAGATVIYWIFTTNSGPASASYGGTAMVSCGSYDIGFYGGSYFYITALKLVGGGTGSAEAVSVVATSSPTCKVVPVSYTGVATVGALQSAGATSGSSASLSATSSSGDMVSIGVVGNSAVSSFNETSRYGTTDILVGDAAGAASVSITGTVTSPWGVGALDMAPSASSYTATPTTATVAITGGTPTVAVTSPGVYYPTTATVTLTGGTPVVTTTGSSFPATPFANLLPKLTSSGTASILCIGDSTVYGYYDGASEGGWVGRLAIYLGEATKSTAKGASYAATVGYAPLSTQYTGTSGATVDVYNGGVIGASLSELETWLSDNTLVPLQPDCIIVGIGINDLVGGEGGATFVSAYQTFLTNLRAACPNAPIVITTENVVDDTGDTGYWVNGFNAMTTWLCGEDMPISPPLQSTSIPGVWVLDTQQAYGDAWNSALMTNAEHPNAAGYTAQAEWMLSELANIFYPTTATVAITGGTPVVTVTAPGLYEPTTATVTLSGGTPTVTVTGPVSAAPASASLAISGGTPAVYVESSNAYFTVDGYFFADQASDYSAGQLGAYVTFIPQVPAGFASFMAGLGIDNAAAPIIGHLVGQSTADGIVWQLVTPGSPNSPGVALIANSVDITNYLAEAGVQGGRLVYEVCIGPIDIAGEHQVPLDFSLVAPTRGSVIGISSKDAAGWGNTIVS